MYPDIDSRGVGAMGAQRLCKAQTWVRIPYSPLGSWLDFDRLPKLRIIDLVGAR